MGYSPYGKTKKILDRAMEHIKSVSYQVGVRWVFYRLLQESLYRGKDDYTNFVSLTSRARHSFYNGWTPETLADETREMIIYNGGGDRPQPDIDELIEREIEIAKGEIEYFKERAENYQHHFWYTIDPNFYLDRFCVVMFEARAMSQQFRAYTHGVTLCPFGGQASIPYKWAIAKHIEQKCRDYNKDAVVLFFGDKDDSGIKIFEAGRGDITEWCSAKVEFIRCGLTEEQAIKYQIPENFEHRGSYQWEALTDPQAREIIESSLKTYYDMEASRRAKREASIISEAVTGAVNEHLQSYEEMED